MRFFICFILGALLLGSCQVGADKKASIKGLGAVKMDSTQFTQIEWLDSTHKDFGKIAEGKKLDVSFRFRNSGDKPLVIERVQVSCGCTIAEQPTEAVLPGKDGIIKAIFNSENHTGVNHKTLYVYANTKGTQSHDLHFDVLVEKKKW